LKRKLKESVRDREATIETQLSYARMLIELDEAPQSLLGDVLASRKERMKKDMVRCVDMAAANAASSGEERKRKSSADAESGSPTSDTAPSELLALLQTQFIEPFIIFAATFVDTFIRPNTAAAGRGAAATVAGSGGRPSNADRERSSSNAAVDKAKQESMEKCNAALIEFTMELFNDYFTLARKEMLKISSLDATATDSAAGSDAAVAANLQLMRKLTRSVAFFYKGLLSPLKLVPKARLGDRAAEIIEHTIRHAVQCVFEVSTACSSSVSRVCRALHC
jgi:hypothetical protein